MIPWLRPDKRERAYASLISGTINLLPAVARTHNRYFHDAVRHTFTVSDPTLPQTILRSTLWSRDGPLYVVGEKILKVDRKGSPKKKSFLLAGMSDNTLGISSATLYGGGLKSLEKDPAIVTPDRLKSMYDRNTNSYVVTATDAPRPRRSVNAGWIESTHITDERMSDYNVFGALASLAIRFDKADEYKALLKAKQAESQSKA